MKKRLNFFLIVIIFNISFLPLKADTTFDLGKKIIHETTLVPDDTVGTIILDVYEITELNKTRIIGEISYLQFMNGLGEKAFGGRKKFSKKYKKQIAESKIKFSHNLIIFILII